LFAEYTISDQVVRRDAGTSSFPRVRNTAWQVAGSYVLTGEDASFKGVIARNPFSVANHTWGAVELVARYGQLDIDNRAFGTLADPATSASKASSWGAGVNWYLNRNVRLSLDYEQTDFTGGTSNFLKSGEKVILSRAQFVF
jgi:phosphate-selective porin OprO/OprP